MTNSSWSIPWRTIGRTLAVLIVFVVGSFLLVAWLGPEPNNTQVIEEWNSTITKLGIDPVFPPEEDVAVGDIYAVLDDSENGQPSRTALALRSIKLTHQDLTADIEKAYKESYLFPDTTPRPTDESQAWGQLQNADGILKHPDKRTTLPLAAFPGFTIRQQGSFSGGLLGWLSTTFGFRSDNGVELNIPVAETYGIPSIEAVGELEKFCADPDDPSRCTDETLRRHLAFVTPRAFELKPKDSNAASAAGGTPSSSANPYKYPLQVVLVNRVYLARYIDQRTERSRSGQTGIGRSKLPAKTENAATAEKQPTRDTDPGTGTNDAGLKMETSDSQGLKQTFLRPIAIGYRAVKRVPKDNVIDPKTDTNKKNVTVSRKAPDCFNGSSVCSREVLASTPPVALNAAQSTDSIRQDNNDAKRFRLYLHTAKQSKDVVAKITDVLTKAGYAITGSEEDVDTDGGAGVDYFSEGDSVGATNIAKIVSAAFGATGPTLAVPPRRQKVYNPIGVLGIWLPENKS